MAPFTESLVDAAGVRVHLRRGGSGDPLLILHGELGVPGWLRAYEALAQHYTVHVPSLPGFGQSSRPAFILGVRDLAAWVTWLVRDQRLAHPLPVIGFSLGGWVAAEIATVNAALFSKMVLVGAAGLNSSARARRGRGAESGGASRRLCPSSSRRYSSSR